MDAPQGCRFINKCRVCGGGALTTLLPFGDHPLANGLKRAADEPERKYPLTLLFCDDCSLVQLRETVDKEILFKSYFWVTGTSAGARGFAQEFYATARRVAELRPGATVFEIASNDGTFLKPFVAGGFAAVGFDPAVNVAEIANQDGVLTHARFWNPETARAAVEEHGPADFIFARNVVPHVSELHDVVSALAQALSANGVGAIEFHYTASILSQLQYDSVYHEHLCYFSVSSLSRLLSRHGLHPFDAQASPISGGACVVYFSRDEKRGPSENLKKYRAEERASLLNDKGAWLKFADRCREHRSRAREMLQKGKKIIGFGASARSSTFLNFCGFTRDDLHAIIDNNKLKWNHFTPGSSIKIVPLEEGLALKPDQIFVLAWNFKDEIIRECRARGYQGSFLVPFPNEPYRIEKAA